MMLLKPKAPGSSLTRESPPHDPPLNGGERARSAKLAAREPVTRQTSHPSHQRASASVPNTGRFYLLDVEGVRSQDGRLLELTRVYCRCLQCSAAFTAIPSQGLEPLEGGATIKCPKCGEHQAISLFRFEDFSRQHRSDIA